MTKIDIKKGTCICRCHRYSGHENVCGAVIQARLEAGHYSEDEIGDIVNLICKKNEN